MIKAGASIQERKTIVQPRKYTGNRKDLPRESLSDGSEVIAAIRTALDSYNSLALDIKFVNFEYNL